MKVALPKDYRKLFTLEELDIARGIIRDMKDDDSTPAWYAEIALHHAMQKYDDYLVETFKATAEVAKNHRAWNAYSDDSQNMDVWVCAVAETIHGFMKLGAYLTDIWNIGNGTDYTDRFYIQYAKKQ